VYGPIKGKGPKGHGGKRRRPQSRKDFSEGGIDYDSILRSSGLTTSGGEREVPNVGGGDSNSFLQKEGGRVGKRLPHREKKKGVVFGTVGGGKKGGRLLHNQKDEVRTESSS